MRGVLTFSTAAYIRLHRTIQQRRCFTAQAKLITMTGSRQIATHDGAFHCDEVLACHMLHHHTKAYQHADIVRTRDPEKLEKADIVVDVGAKYDVEKHRFDHHQRGFEGTFESLGKRSRTKLSSAGLVYKHFGEEVVDSILRSKDVSLSTEDLKLVYLKVYESFMEAIDGIDNGVQMYQSDSPARYESSTDLSSRVGRLNAEWYEQNPDQDSNFRNAMLLAGAEFDACVQNIATSWLPARTIVAKAFNARMADHGSGAIMVMRDFAPWKDHIYTLEEEKGQTDIGDDIKEGDAAGQTKVLYVLYEDITKSSWRIQCVAVSKGSFQSRKALPELWRGVRDEELSSVTGIEGCVFVHASGFIGGNKTYEGVKALAEKALVM